MVVLAASRHRPHELFLLGVSVLLGVSYLVTVPAPQSLAAAVPRWAVLLWAAGLLVSGVTGLVGCGWKGQPPIGLGLERGAMLLSTAALLLMASASVAANGERAAWGAGLTIAWALANSMRVRQIGKELREIRAASLEPDDG